MKRSLILFIGRFFGSYLILFLLYQTYLNAQKNVKIIHNVDGITKLVANWSGFFLKFIFNDVQLVPHATEASVKVFINGTYLVRVIEGCNSISVLILFTAFIVSFYNRFWRTFSYLLVGNISIFLLNIFRIVFLTFCLDRYSFLGDILHSIVFPGIIYSYVVLLWFVWIQYFSKFKTHG